MSFFQTTQKRIPEQTANGAAHTDNGDTKLAMSTTNNVPVLLLTAAIDAGNAPGAMFSKSERMTQYLSSFSFYIRFLRNNPDLCKGIVFCENSGADLSRFRQLVPLDISNRVELLSLPTELFNSARGKTYNEMLAIDCAQERSILLDDEMLFLKLTGRYPIWNIKRLSRDLAQNYTTIESCFFRLPFPGDKKSRFRPMVDTRCIAVRSKTWKRYFQGRYQLADEKGGYFFEYIAMDIVSAHLGEKGWISGFSHPPLILGKQGHPKRIGRFTIPKQLEPLYLLAAYVYHLRCMKNTENRTRD